jgi:hypothetical protein
MTRSTAAGVLLSGFLAGFPTVAQAESPPSHLVVTPSELKWTDVAALPGAKLAVIEGPLTEAVPFTMRLKLPADYKIPAHWHPAIEHVTVIPAASTWEWVTSSTRAKPRHLRPAASPSCSLRRRTLRGPTRRR